MRDRALVLKAQETVRPFLMMDTVGNATMSTGRTNAGTRGAYRIS